MVQYEPENRDKEKIVKILAIIHNAKSKTPIEELSTTSEISLAYYLPPACTYLGRNFTGIDLYEENVVRAQNNIAYAVSEICKLNEK